MTRDRDDSKLFGSLTKEDIAMTRQARRLNNAIAVLVTTLLLLLTFSVSDASTPFDDAREDLLELAMKSAADSCYHESIALALPDGLMLSYADPFTTSPQSACESDKKCHEKADDVCERHFQCDAKDGKSKAEELEDGSNVCSFECECNSAIGIVRCNPRLLSPMPSHPGLGWKRFYERSPRGR